MQSEIKTAKILVQFSSHRIIFVIPMAKALPQILMHRLIVWKNKWEHCPGACVRTTQFVCEEL